MKYSLSLPVDQTDPPAEFCSGEAIAEIAKAAEAAGFSAVHATEHPFPSRVGPEMGGHQALDPIVTMSFVAAATRTLRLHTNGVVLPYRNPFLVAKAFADLDVASGGRVIAGIVPGYLAGEFAALGVSLDDRNALMEEGVAAMKAAWSGEPVHMKSGRWRAQGNVMRPKPHQQPHPPVWLGGNSLAAVRRAARHGQGWMAFPTTPQEASVVRTAAVTSIGDLTSRIALLREEAEAAGRNQQIDVCMTPFTHQHHPRGQERYEPAVLLEEAERLAEIGVTWLTVKARSPDRATFLENIQRWGEEVLRVR
jgi:probable F420-dependent oxidoreductase